jgi:hypothetical protein
MEGAADLSLTRTRLLWQGYEQSTAAFLQFAQGRSPEHLTFLEWHLWQLLSVYERQRVSDAGGDAFWSVEEVRKKRERACHTRRRLDLRCRVFPPITHCRFLAKAGKSCAAQ